MRACPFCGQLIEAQLKYCPHCGTRVNSGRIIPVKQARRKIIWFIIPTLIILLLSTLIYRFYSTSRLLISPTNIEFFKYGGEDIVEINYDGFTWRVDKSPSWLELTTHDRRLLITATPNLTGKLRRDSIIISSGSLRAVAHVKQLATATFLRLSQSSDSAAAIGDTISIVYESDGLAPVLTLPDYCHEVNRYNDEIFIAVSPNNTDRNRKIKIILNDDTCSANATFIQPYLEEEKTAD